MGCENSCYEAQVNGCDNITLKAGLTPDTSYFVQVFKNNNSAVYQREFTTNAEGLLQLSKASFPPGYFTPGFFTLTVKTAAYLLKPMTFNEVEYDCVLFQVISTDVEEGDTSPISTIQ